MNQEDVQKAWNMMSMHNSELLLENEELKRQLMRKSLSWGLTYAFVTWWRYKYSFRVLRKLWKKGWFR